MAFYQKYRPNSFSELIGEEHISSTILQGIKNNKLTHAYLLTGPRGTGKTTTARLLAKAINCIEINSARERGEEISGEPCNKCDSCHEISEGRSVDVIEIDAASHTKVDEIREVIENARFMPTKSKKKVYIIDEVHMLSNSSFNALLKTLEEPPSHVVFILATTEVHKLPATILSRTQRYDFHRILKDDIVKNLKNIADTEKIEIDLEALNLIAIAAEGGHRDAIGLLEQVASMSNQHLGVKDVENMLGIASDTEVFSFVKAIFNKIPEEGLKIAHHIFEDGANMTSFNKSVIEVLRKLLLYKMSNKILFEDTAEHIEAVKDIGNLTTVSEILRLIDIFVKAGSMLKNVAYPILPIEIAVVESCANIPESVPRQTAAKAEVQKVSTPVHHVEALPTSPIQIDRSKKIDKMPVDSPIPVEKESSFVPVSVLQMTDDLWQGIIETTKKENATLAALLRDAKPLEVSENKVILGVKFPFHKDKISEEKNRMILEKIFSEAMGGKCILSCKISEIKPTSSAPAKDDELNKVAEEIFG